MAGCTPAAPLPLMRWEMWASGEERRRTSRARTLGTQSEGPQALLQSSLVTIAHIDTKPESTDGGGVMSYAPSAPQATYARHVTRAVEALRHELTDISLDIHAHPELNY